MKLANLLMERRVKLGLRAKTKDDAVQELLDMLRREGVQFDYEAVLGSVREREVVEDTSYGHGFAFPHARTDSVAELFILVGISRTGLADKCGDQSPVHVVCLLPARRRTSPSYTSRRFRGWPG